jgi:hypothetical protein
VGGVKTAKRSILKSAKGGEKMKKFFEEPVAEVINVTEDVIVTSGGCTDGITACSGIVGD